MYSDYFNFNNKILRYSFIFVIAIVCILLFPQDSYALDFSSSPYYCKYYDGVMDECGNAYYGQFVNAANNYGWYAPNTTIDNFISSSNNYVRLEHSNQSFCDGDGQGYGGTIDFYYWFDTPIAKYFTTSNFDMNFDPLAFTCTHEVTLDGYGLVFHCSTNKSFTNATIGTNMRYVSGGDTYLGEDAIVGVGTWTATYECTTNETDIIVNNNNANTDKIIDNNNANTDKIVESQDKINDTLNDDDVSDANDTASGFFNDFELNDNGGISSIVTMPLTIINGLISGESSCSNLEFSILGKDVYFPGGCMMWDNVSSVHEMLYQTIICGFFGYILLTMLFKDIEDLKNPNDEEVSTLDL